MEGFSGKEIMEERTKLRAARSMLGWTQEQAGFQCSPRLSPSHISRLERGTSVSFLAQYATKLADYLPGGDPDRVPDIGEPFPDPVPMEDKPAAYLTAIMTGLHAHGLADIDIGDVLFRILKPYAREYLPRREGATVEDLLTQAEVWQHRIEKFWEERRG